MEKLKQIFECLQNWYPIVKRDLPWRQTKNPYHIWVSEIMLQQTRVETVKPYYARFLEQLPTVADLANAPEEQILKLWEGLGYYSRVRNMQTAAKQVMTEYGGIIPADHKKLLSLKGIGSYTAGAISSIAFDLPFSAVDGNVLRVMSRVFADTRDIASQSTKKSWEEELNLYLTSQNAGIINQALMELGATVCIPNGAPKCDICPLRIYCKAYQQNTMLAYPVKSEKKPRTKEYLSVCFLTDGKRVALHKRACSGLLANLWELPNIKQELALPIALSDWHISKAEITTMQQRKHIFTHVEWYMEGYYILIEEIPEHTEFIWVTPEEQSKTYALPTAFQKVWKDGKKRLQK